MAMEAGRRGVDAIPALLKNVLPRAMAGARAGGLAPTAVYLCRELSRHAFIRTTFNFG